MKQKNTTKKIKKRRTKEEERMRQERNKEMNRGHQKDKELRRA